MRSTYVLVEQSELHNFIHELEALNSWARKMAGLSTSITAPAPLGTRAVRPRPRHYADGRPTPPDPFDSSAWNTTTSGEYYTVPAAPRPQAFQHHQNLNQPFGGMGQGYGGFEYQEPAPMGYDFHPPPPGLVRGCAGLMGMRGDRLGGEIRERRGASDRPCQAPVKNGPHRTPIITRVPNNSHTPQRGAMYVRRPRRVRPQRNAGNAGTMGDGSEDTEGEGYVEEEDDQVVGDEREAR